MKENPFTKRSKILEENRDYLDHTVKTISKVFIEVIKNNGKLIFAGNGGSAAEAQHMSAEYVGTLVTSNKRNPIPSLLYQLTHLLLLLGLTTVDMRIFLEGSYRH